jgi:hypothetical protein
MSHVKYILPCIVYAEFCSAYAELIECPHDHSSSKDGSNSSLKVIVIVCNVLIIYNAQRPVV